MKFRRAPNVWGLPKTQEWNHLIGYVAGVGSTSDIPAAAAVDAIAAQTPDAAQGALTRAAHDSGVCYTFYLMTQLAVASRTSDWEKALSDHGIHLSQVSSVSEFTFEVQDAIDRYIDQSPSGATDLSEIAQQSHKLCSLKHYPKKSEVKPLAEAYMMTVRKTMTIEAGASVKEFVNGVFLPKSRQRLSRNTVLLYGAGLAAAGATSWLSALARCAGV